MTIFEVKYLINKKIQVFGQFILDFLSANSKYDARFFHIYSKIHLNKCFINKIRFSSGNGGKQGISIRKLLVKKTQGFLTRD